MKFFKKYKEIFIVFLIILVVIIIQIINVLNANRDKNKNEIFQVDSISEVTIEEKTLSMKKGDVFAKVGNTIIYINDFNENIYMVNLNDKTFKNLCHLEDGVSKIYFDGDYIYAIPSYYRGKGIYKIDLLGNVKKIYTGASIQLWIDDEIIYFTDQIGYDQINGTPQGNLCSMDKEGNNKKVIIENVKNYFYIVDNYIYYTDQNSRSIFRANIDGTQKTELAIGRTYITSVTDKYLTYLDYNDGEKHRILYFDNKQNNEIGRFGNVCSSKSRTYFYTRKIVDSNNNIENELTLFSIDNENKTEHWTSDEISPDYLSYVYNGYGYFRKGSQYYRVNTNNKAEKEQLEFGSGSYFVDGKVYSFKRTDGIINGLYIYDLENMEKYIIKNSNLL